MLVLTRKRNESIIIGGNVTVTVVEIKADKVRLGVVNPREIPVHRQEVHDAIHGAGATPAAEPLASGTERFKQRVLQGVRARVGKVFKDKKLIDTIMAEIADIVEKAAEGG